MDASTITLLAFSSALVVGSLTTIIIVNYRRFCKKSERVVQDWVVSENVTV
jgi:hypothetical protein